MRKLFLWSNAPGNFIFVFREIVFRRLVLKFKNVSDYKWVLFFILGLVTSSAMAAQGRQQLHGHRNSKMAAAPLAGEVSSDKHFNLAVALPLQNADQLKTFIAQVSDPNSPFYRHYLTSNQFTQTYGPTEQDYQAVVSYLQSKGLKVTGNSVANSCWPSTH